MSRFRFISALVVSVALIGGALWFRFFQPSPEEVRIAVVPTVEEMWQNLPKESEGSYGTGATTPDSLAPETQDSLTPAGMVSRGLFTDFAMLQNQGQVTPANLDLLIEKYAEELTQFSASVEVNISHIVIATDTEENLAVYGQAAKNIRNKYASLASAQNNLEITANPASPEFKNFMTSVGLLYEQAAKEFLVLPVPTSLATNHINLVNNHLETAEIMRMIGNIDKEKIGAIAAMGAFTQNSAEENSLFLNIRRTLAANGIIYDQGI